MPPPKPPLDSSPDPAVTPSPQRTPTAKHGNPSTPANRKFSASGDAVPKSAPAAARQVSGSPASQRKKAEPSLLSDFLLGRPSPARVAAQKAAQGQPRDKRRRSFAAADAAGVREELRQEMRAAAIRKVQRPGGVQERVKAWQKANAAAIKSGAAEVGASVEVAPSEPTEVHVDVDAESVTEEDRVRIKMRQKAKKRKPSKSAAKAPVQTDADSGEDDDAGSEEDELAHPENTDIPRSKETPKKRIISDEHWMKKRKGKSPPRTAPAKGKAGGDGMPIPKDFLLRTAQNPPVQSKIRDWAMRVENPDPPKPRKRHTKSEGNITVDEDLFSQGDSSDSSHVRSRRTADDNIRVNLAKSRQQKSDADDGIRIKPLRKKDLPDDGIRVRPLETSSLPNDGIRIRPMETSSLPDDGIRVRPGPPSSGDGLRTPRASSQRAARERGARSSSAKRDPSPSDVIEVTEEPESEVYTPTKRRTSAGRKPRRTVTPTTVTQAETMDTRSSAEDSDRTPHVDYSDVGSEIPSTVLGGNKSLADIPFGYSAFSELDLPLGADARNSVRRPKGQRNPSFRAVPKVFKKVVSEGKKIIHDKVDPPKPVVNNPPSIESWLINTVDPFVDSPKPKKATAEKVWTQDSRRRSSEPPSQEKEREKEKEKEPQPQPQPQPKQADSKVDQENTDQPTPGDTEVTPKKQTSATAAGSGLKRSRATRSSSSPLKPTTQRRPFREQLKDAFRGESGGHRLAPVVCKLPDSVYDDDQDESEYTRTDSRRRSSGSNKRSPSPDPPSTVESSIESSILSDPSTVDPPKRRPPTNGHHALSTILSEGSASSYLSDETSTVVSQTTITQTTATTQSSGLSREKSRKSGLKRRLTKHSDLVSVLSLPDGQLVAPSRSRSIKSSHSLRRNASKASGVTADDLLDEFADDEHFYRKELKTLVDGVIPVLLTQVVEGEESSPSAGVFGGGHAPAQKAKSMAKAVVNMGVVLEELKDFHKRVPLSDIPSLLSWLQSVQPVYDNYLDVWRLGFEDLIVNLAPALARLEDDNDSLVNAMPRNEEGDVLDHDGERVDVAQLLKRPIIRIKWVVKFLTGAQSLPDAEGAKMLLESFEKLQEKVRRRHREEKARKTDEDAANTDTTRTRDLRTLANIDNVMIDPSRQVNAKDAFSLDLLHPSGQRIECSIDLIYRDNLRVPADKGDIILRETGSAGRSWLLFPPIPKPQISARRGEGDGVLTIMVRGTHNKQEWHQLIDLSADDDEQIADWLSILGSNPMPPEFPSDFAKRLRHAVQAPKPSDMRVPDHQSPSTPKSKTPSRYHQRSTSTPTTPPSSRSPANGRSPSPNRTPTQESFSRSSRRGESPGEETPTKSGRAPPNTMPYREDGAPPPPIHRTLAPKTKKGPSLAPVELGVPSRMKRRTSSPLKHEYHPSDISSESSDASDSSDSLTESSDDDDDLDDFDERNVPMTPQSVSIKEHGPTPRDSVLSDISLTPSNSASQTDAAKAAAEYSVKSVASVSYWSNKSNGWKDVSLEACSIVVTPGLMEVFPLTAAHSNAHGSSENANDEAEAKTPRPLIALELTPQARIRMSTVIDVEVRFSPIRSHTLRRDVESSTFRFRAPSKIECRHLFDVVYHSCENNSQFNEQQEEARINSFGQQQSQGVEGSVDVSTFQQRRSWFGRKNSYRASARAPSVSQGSSSGVSASSFLKRLTSGGNLSFDIGKSTLDKQSRPGSVAGVPSSSRYTSSTSSSGGRSGFSFPRLPSISMADGNSRNQPLGTTDLKIRLHRLVKHHKWEDRGNCLLDIMRPDPNAPQQLRPYHGRSKRIVVRSIPKKRGEEPSIVVDLTVGSSCFSTLGNTGVVINVWEEMRDEDGNIGVVPAQGGLSGGVVRWCLQCPNVAQWMWIMNLVTQEGFAD